MRTDANFKETDYLKFFGLDYNPFPVAPDEDNFFISENIDRILTEIVHGITARKGFMVLTGDVGLGKTTISRKIINIIEEKGVETSLVLHTSYQDSALLNEINRDFGLNTRVPNFGDRMKLLNDFLLEQNLKGNNCAIIIDDAQNLDFKSLELIRMISNLETGRQKLVQILLIGQPELMEKLNSNKLRQLKSRIIIQKEAKPITPEDLKNYLHFKLNLAGNKGLITIKKNAPNKIHQFTRGNFRQINILMDRCLYVACLHNTRKIGKKIVAEACEDLDSGKSKPKNHTLIFALSATVLLCVIAWFAYSKTPASTPPPVHRIVRMPAVTSQTKKTGKNVKSKIQTPDKQAAVRVIKPDDKKNDIPEPVLKFLKVYRLSRFRESFFKALKTGKFQNEAEAIFKQSGLQLIQLEHVPDHIREKYDILSYPGKSENKKYFFLFWKPELNINKFYYSFQGDNIFKLQKILAKINLYNDRLDGNVGKNLMKAVVSFQKQTGLLVNGYPDKKTVFLLCNLKENFPNE